MLTSDIRSRFIDYFARRGHDVVPSASLLYNDPTLLFVNAGMVPFKPYFLGEEPAPFARAVSVQKCVRTLDIEEVGKTTRHGTFFQMLGNFAFADYFKKEAIAFAWELVTSPESHGGLGFDAEKVWVTALRGDEETIRHWRAVGMPRERIQERGLKDNYWHMGVPGPGGPCSEIYIDRGPAFGSEGGPVVDEDRYLEIWNLVFQSEELEAVRAKDDFDVLRPLPANNIDTGSGLERIACLKQGVANLYETDQVYPVIVKAEEMTGKRYGADANDDVSFRVVADHVRSALMLMTDGVTPGNEARGYVLRRLLRRVVRAMRLLGVHDPVLGELMPVSRAAMETSYPDVKQQWSRVIQSAQAEEETFRKTLQAGTAMFDMAVQTAKQQGTTLPTAAVFKLHDTYGFPIDLTLEMAAEQGLTVDRRAFDALMREQKDRARADAKAKKAAATNPEAYRQLRESGETPFTGYRDLALATQVRGIVTDGSAVDRAGDGEIVEVVLEATPFYAEAGGQDADHGQVLGDGFTLDVLDVQRPIPGLIVHRVAVSGELVAGTKADAIVDAQQRHAASQAHTATHIVHAALRELVGDSATQAGSYNKPGYLRFDYSATQPMSAALRREIEQRVNQAILDDFQVSEHHMKLEEATALGAMAMFGEKYPPVVRMVELGGAWSRELCGGTHVTNTSQIGLLNLVSEGSIGSGVRRVEALVSSDAFAQFAAERALVRELTDTLRVAPEMLPERVIRLVAELKAAEKQIAKLQSQQLLAGADKLLDSTERVGDVNLLAATLPGVAAADLRRLAVDLRGRMDSAVGAVVALIGGEDKPAAVVATNERAREQGWRAGEFIRGICAGLGGKGGGKDDLAQGGGTDAKAADRVLAEVREALAARG